MEESFSKHSSSTYDLSILVGMDRFFYCISDRQQHVLVLRSYTYPPKNNYIQLKSALQKTLLDDSLLRLSFRSTKISLVSLESTLVPSALYDADKTQFYLEHTVGQDTLNTVGSEFIEDIDANNVYAFNSAILSLLRTYFPQAKFYHIATSLIKAYGSLAEHSNGPQLYINVLQETFQAAVFDGKDLFYYNSFNYRSTKDFIYFVQLIYSQLKLSQEKTPINISGELVEESEVYKLLYRYIRNIHFVQLPPFYRFGERFHAISKHFFYDLYSLKLCE